MENNTIKKSIDSITIGVRFSRSFRIPDMSGEIIDNILHDPKSPFDTKFFPHFNETSTKEKTLFNKEGENIKITSDDFILTLKVNGDFEKKYTFIKDQVFEYLIDLFSLFSIENITRIGVLFYCSLENTKKLNEAVSTLTNESIKDIHTFDLSFSQKRKTEEGLIKKGVKDYVNIIFTLVKNKKEESLSFNFDYQKFFLPISLTLKDTKIDKHLEKAMQALENEYEKWIKDYDKQ